MSTLSSTPMRRSRLALPAVLVALSLDAATIHAVDFYVDSTLDQIDDDVLDGVCHTAAGTCTLRAAVMQANRITGPGATIHLPAGTYTLTRPALGANGDDAGDLNFTTPASGLPLIQVIGSGAATTIIDANQLDRVVRVEPGRVASLSFLTLRNGFTGGVGGGILVQGFLTLGGVTIEGCIASQGGGAKLDPGASLTMVESVVRDNRAMVDGGGIWLFDATAVVQRSTVSSNIAEFGGGGVLSRGDLLVDRSTISGNLAQRGEGGGILANGESLTILESTVSSNAAGGSGGGIYLGYAQPGLNVYSSTIAFNQADLEHDGVGEGGGIFRDPLPSQPANFRNCLIVGNYESLPGNPNDCRGTIVSYGRNLFSDTLFCDVVTGSGGWDWLSDLASIGPLAANGGPTFTHALLPGCGAIDDGDPVLGCTGPTGLFLVDQRGVDRIIGPSCDIGAFEYDYGALFSDDFESGDTSAWQGG